MCELINKYTVYAKMFAVCKFLFILWVMFKSYKILHSYDSLLSLLLCTSCESHIISTKFNDGAIKTHS